MLTFGGLLWLVLLLLVSGVTDGTESKLKYSELLFFTHKKKSVILTFNRKRTSFLG
jgi:hypothetical protein